MCKLYLSLSAICRNTLSYTFKATSRTSSPFTSIQSFGGIFSTYTHRNCLSYNITAISMSTCCIKAKEYSKLCDIRYYQHCCNCLRYVRITAVLILPDIELLLVFYCLITIYIQSEIWLHFAYFFLD